MFVEFGGITLNLAHVAYFRREEMTEVSGNIIYRVAAYAVGDKLIQSHYFDNEAQRDGFYKILQEQLGGLSICR